MAECGRLLDAADASEPGFDGVVARACRRPELLLLGALLHDIGKGQPGDHSHAGAETATAFTRRIGLDSEGREIVTWLVRNHLLMADVATRRDLSDAAVADNLAATCAADAERLRLLYLLTIGDSRATGPAAWGPTKAALVRDLFKKAAAAIERGAATAVAADRRLALVASLGADDTAAYLEQLPDAYVLAFEVDEMREHAPLLASGNAVHCRRDDDGVSITIVAPDRPRLLATLAGALAVCGLDVVEAHLFVTTEGLALDVFRAADPYGRLTDGSEEVEAVLRRALAGDLDVDARRRGPQPRLPAAGSSRARAGRRRSRIPGSRQPTPCWKCTPTTRSGCSTASRRRWPTSASTYELPRWPPSASGWSTRSTSATPRAPRSSTARRSTHCATR